jgi:hypothetical protein
VTSLYFRTTFLVVVAVFGFASDSPAPISEEPSPTPRATAARHSSESANGSDSRPKKRAPETAIFAGTWNGAVTSTYRDNQGETGTASAGCWITISADGKIVTANGDIGWGEVRSPVVRNGNVFTWSGHPANPSVPLSSTSTCRLEINSRTTASFTGTRVIINGFLKGTTYKFFGTLTKE